MNRTLVAAATLAALAGGVANAVELAVPPSTFGRLDHVFLIMMENQTNTDILGNPNAPYINWYVNIANQATNYFAVGHPSAPNYLEIVGGSNFNLTNDFWPVWVNLGCVDNSPGSTGCNGAFTPISAPGFDNPLPATANSGPAPNGCNGQLSFTGPPVANNCALYNYPSMLFTPKSIADQLVATGRVWKTYQESLPTVPLTGGNPPPLPLPPFGVNYSDGMWSNLSPVAVFGPGPIQKLYAVKHNPFAYFQNIEVGSIPALSFRQVVDFDGPNGLWADLAIGAPPALNALLTELNFKLGPNLWFIVPNQCHDMHGFVSGGTPICSTNTQAEINYAIQQGDAEVNKLITGIHNSKAWQAGRNVIVLVWDENDYSNAANRVVMTVETNYAPNGRKYAANVDHYSLLRTLEAGFGLPCLNHACDQTSLVLNYMFGGTP
jgi:hypothetical protein